MVVPSPHFFTNSGDQTRDLLHGKRLTVPLGLNLTVLKGKYTYMRKSFLRIEEPHSYSELESSGVMYFDVFNP